MYCDQRRRTRRVHRHRRPVQSEYIGDAPRSDTAGQPGGQVALQHLSRADPVAADRVVRRHPARENAGVAAAHRQEIDAGRLEGLPGDFQEHSLLRVHRQRFSRRDSEEAGIEVRGRYETAHPPVGLPHLIGIGIVEAVQIPTAIRREIRHHVAARRQHLPQPARVTDPAGKSAAHPHHCDGLAVPALEGGQPLVRFTELRRGPLEVFAEKFRGFFWRFGLVAHCPALPVERLQRAESTNPPEKFAAT